MITLMAGTALAQPRQRRTQQQPVLQQGAQPRTEPGVQMRIQQPRSLQNTQQNTQQGGMTQRMRIQYPTALDMPEDVVWRRDIYRELDLTQEENAGLYDPVEPQGKRMNLFTYALPTPHGLLPSASCLPVLAGDGRMLQRLLSVLLAVFASWPSEQKVMKWSLSTT